ncbi:MAG: hypothetical protein HY921_08265 [Elusimicrobia bacterium]|nr:hypothetical protein [Elusimicrobiota bacterium]
METAEAASIEGEIAPEILELESRLARLTQAAEESRDRLRGQNPSLKILRREFNSLKAILHEQKRKIEQLETSSFREARLSAAPARPSFLHFFIAPLLGLLALGLHLSKGIILPPTPSKASARLAPAPTAQGEDAPRDAGVDLLPEDGDVDEALRLIYAYAPSGGSGSVAEILAPEIGAATESSPWLIERLSRDVYHFTLRPYGEVSEFDTPIYEFEVDLEKKKVMPSAETALHLAPQASDLARH